MNIFHKILLIASLIFGSIGMSYAQQKNKFYFTDIYTIKGRSQYSHLRVLDMRTDKYNLGFLRRGPLKKEVSLEAEIPFGQMLSEEFSKMLSASKDGYEEGELLLVLYDVHAESKDGDNSVGTFFWDGDFYARVAHDRYRYLGTVDSTYEALPGGRDVNKLLIKGMRLNFGYVLSKYATQEVANSTHPVTEAELVGKRTAKNNKYEIYRLGGAFKQGVYFTEEQFLNNTPVDTPVFIKGYTKSASPKRFWSVHVLDALSAKKVQIPAANIFAVYDGRYWVSGMSHEFSTMEFRGGEFYAVKWCKGGRDIAPAVILFGAVGVILFELNEMKHPGMAEYYSKYNAEKKQFIPLYRMY